MGLNTILSIEAVNHKSIYLYPYKSGAWICYAHSADLLYSIYPNIYHSEKKISGWESIITVVVIDSLTLEHLIDNLHPKERNGEKIVIEIPDAYLSYLR